MGPDSRLPSLQTSHNPTIQASVFGRLRVNDGTELRNVGQDLCPGCIALPIIGLEHGVTALSGLDLGIVPELLAHLVGARAEFSVGNRAR